MNKLLIVLLAVCLVSVHAFVRRDAPAPAPAEEDGLKKMGVTINEFGKKLGTEIEKVFNPETMKKEFNELVDNVSKKLDEFKAKSVAS